jgi:hypothetical protein
MRPLPYVNPAEAKALLLAVWRRLDRWTLEMFNP